MARGHRALGTVAFGRQDSGTVVGSPIHSPAARIVDLMGYDAGPTAISGSILNACTRTSNAMGDAGPQWGGVTPRARFNQRSARTPAEPKDAAHSLDLGLDFSQGPVYASLAYGRDKRKGGLQPHELEDKLQPGMRYRIGASTPYALSKRTEVQAFIDNDAVDSSRRSVRVQAIGAGLRHMF